MAGVPLSKEIDLIHLWSSRSEWNSSLILLPFSPFIGGKLIP
jgi:hypothetical protein